MVCMVVGPTSVGITLHHVQDCEHMPWEDIYLADVLAKNIGRNFHRSAGSFN